jgi:hypothetical protein
MRIASRLATFGIVALFAAPALAEPRDPAAAEALFRLGRGAVEKGDYQAACAKFEESRRLDPTLGTLFNLADCNEHIGKLASAWQLFKEVSQRASTGDERIGIANARAVALEPRLPKLVMKVSAPLPSQTVVLRDGVEMGSGGFDVPLPVDVGEHIIVVKSPGRADRQYTSNVAEAQTGEISLEAGAVLPPRTTPLPGASAGTDVGTSAGGRRTLGVALLGIGTAGLVTGAVTGAIALAAKKTVDSGCDSDKRCSSEALDAADRGRTASTISTIAFSAGVVGTVAGVYFLLTRGSDAKSAALRTSVGVAVVPGQAFISVNGRLW